LTRVVAVVGALLITSVLLLLAVTGVSWFMNSPAVWAIAREPWFQPATMIFNATFVPMIVIWVALRTRHKRPEPAPTRISPIRD
jgi:hypothetical protein